MHNRHPQPERHRGNSPTIVSILLITLGISFAASVLTGKADPTQSAIGAPFSVQGR